MHQCNPFLGSQGIALMTSPNHLGGYTIMPNFDEERFSASARQRQTEFELAKVQRILYLIQQNYKMQLWQMAEQMNQDFEKLSDYIVQIRNFNDPD